MIEDYILNTLRNIRAIRAIGNYNEYRPEHIHKDTIYFAQDLNKIYLNGVCYGSYSNDQLATVNYVNLKVNDLIDGAPEALDTLKEIADELSNQESATSALINTITERKVKDVTGSLEVSEDGVADVKTKGITIDKLELNVLNKLNTMPSVVSLTQAEYEALTVKDPNTLYCIPF